MLLPGHVRKFVRLRGRLRWGMWRGMLLLRLVRWHRLWLRLVQ